MPGTEQVLRKYYYQESRCGGLAIGLVLLIPPTGVY